jgi:hypothetical protein
VARTRKLKRKEIIGRTPGRRKTMGLIQDAEEHGRTVKKKMNLDLDFDKDNDYDYKD